MTDTLLQSILDRIRNALPLEKVVLFGSYADGSENTDSDVDLLVVTNTDLNSSERFSLLSRALGDLPYAFDLIIKTPDEYNRTRNVVNHIVYFADKYGKVVYEQ